MLDIKHIINNIDKFRESAKHRNMDDWTEELSALYKKSSLLQQELETLQQQRNTIAKQSSQQQDQTIRNKLIAEGKEIKEKITTLSQQFETVQQEMQSCAKKIPNLFHPDAPIGKEEKNNLVIKTHGTIPTFSFKPKDHIELGNDLNIIDFERAAAVSGAKFYYLKNQAVLLELALLRFGIDILQKHGFEIFQTPDIAKTSIVDGIGFTPRGNESNIYCIEDEELSLIGTAEITLGGYYANSIIPIDTLPIKIAGISHCFRKEAGAAGQYSKGLYRVHQFTKLEMFSFCKPEDSEKLHQEVLAIEEEIYQTLEIPYRIVDTCTGDLGAPAYRKFDLEAWMPGRGDGEYGEITSTSNCTDYQSRRLGIRSQTTDALGKKQRFFPHMLNGTAIAISRTLVALLENFQEQDGSVRIPESLVKYCGFSSIPSAL